MTASPPVLARPTARVLVVDPAGRVLLLRHGDERGAWISRGGAVEPGESLREAAVRELHEEIGVRAEQAELVGPVLRQRVLWSAGREQWYDGDDMFFVLRAEPMVLDASGRTELEVATIRGHRWWTAADLRCTDEAVFPEGLAALLDVLPADGAWFDAVAVDRVVEQSR